MCVDCALLSHSLAVLLSNSLTLILTDCYSLTLSTGVCLLLLLFGLVFVSPLILYTLDTFFSNSLSQLFGFSYNVNGNAKTSLPSPLLAFQPGVVCSAGLLGPLIESAFCLTLSTHHHSSHWLITTSICPLTHQLPSGNKTKQSKTKQNNISEDVMNMHP